MKQIVYKEQLATNGILRITYTVKLQDDKNIKNKSLDSMRRRPLYICSNLLVCLLLLSHAVKAETFHITTKTIFTV